MDLQGKRALVTGASRGIGLATTRALLAAGARIAVNGRTPGSVATAIDGLHARGRLAAAPGDISTVAGCEAVVDAALGALNLTRAMALELAPDVRVNCVCPGTIDTDMIRAGIAFDGADVVADPQKAKDFYPMKRIGTPDEVAAAILYLASPDAGFVTGIALPIDGGATAGR
jgi:NAD(P)-dependent dehydrogenase (short-subunit alcohol dehydrogenase family)